MLFSTNSNLNMLNFAILLLKIFLNFYCLLLTYKSNLSPRVKFETAGDLKEQKIHSKNFQKDRGK